jgi:hypothetical protein
VDAALRRRLPRSAYTLVAGGHHRLRQLVGRSPGHGRVLPDFVIIGAAKAGTTSLYAWLCADPLVARPKAKEIHYFSFSYERGIDWYRQFFPLERERARFAAAHGRPFVTCEASPSYMNDRRAPARMASVLPDAKLIVLLREPVDRAYSQFQMRRRDGEESIASFVEALAREDPALIGGPPVAPSARTYLERGRYAEHLERWFAHFPRERFHIATLDELAADPQGELDRVHDFLGLPRHRPDRLEPMYTADYEQLRADERAPVAAYFRPHNERLYALLGRDLGWEH